MSLRYIRQVYESWAREEPFHAVLGADRYRGADGVPDGFFESGRRDVESVLAYVDEVAPTSGRERALDFGCGVGRLTRALAEHYRKVVGVDIARPMVEKARELNVHGDRVRHVVNEADDLGLFPDDHFDLVYSSIVLQHVPPRLIERYLAEFVRVLAPDGVATFQLPDGPRVPPGSLRHFLYRLRRKHLRRLWKRIRGKPAYEMHYLARSRVEEVIRESGGEVVAARPVGHGEAGSGLRYVATPVPR